MAASACDLPTPGGIPTDCTRFGEFARPSSGGVATSPLIWNGVGGPRVALHRWRGATSGSAYRWQHRLCTHRVDQRVGRDAGGREAGVSEPRESAGTTPAHRDAA